MVAREPDAAGDYLLCRQKLIKPLGAKLPALEKLLKVFQDPDA
jgi:hypothetical protein